MIVEIPKDSLVDRFMRYVQIDTQSDPESTTSPSTDSQKKLANLLVQELTQMGVTDAHMDSFGLVYATVPATSSKSVPVICFCAHMDTSPDCPGANVRPILHQHYPGGDIVLPADPPIVIRPSDHPDLLQQIGNDIITADGTTLLGADNKAGIAAIMESVQWLMQHPHVPHGTLRILFTPDEEIGRGVDHIDLKKLNATYAYTVDGESLGTIETETWFASQITITIQGLSAHPGFAKGKMENAVRIAAAIVDALPKTHMSPETTEGREGFIHPQSVTATLEQAVVKCIVRDFSASGLQEKEELFKQLCSQVMKKFPRSSWQWHRTEQYRNMKEVLDQHPHVVTFAMDAMRRAGLHPRTVSVRGGTDGARLSFMGLPCPNLFAGEHAFHSRQEWVSVQDMQKAAETLVHLAMIWEQRSETLVQA